MHLVAKGPKHHRKHHIRCVSEHNGETSNSEVASFEKENLLIPFFSPCEVLVSNVVEGQVKGRCFREVRKDKEPRKSQV